MQSLSNKVVVITGAASGIGRALALHLAGRGCRLLLADLNATGLAETAALALRQTPAAEIVTELTDSGNEAAIFALAEVCKTRFGAADIVINNAGVALVSSVEKLQTTDAQWLININFWGVVHGCRAFLPQLKTRSEALIVNVSSIFAMVSVPTQSIYNASKAAVRGFSDALRQELRDTPVRVLCVHPGGIKTNIVNSARMLDLTLLPLDEAQMRQNFEHNARTTAEQAAACIVDAIERGSTRLLIGPDAKILDWIYRIWPASASAWLTRLSMRMSEKYKFKHF